MNTKAKIGLCLLPTALLSASCQVKKQEQQKPNIVFIFCDDMTAQALSPYGGPVSKLAPTPNINKLAKEGIIFRNSFVENSLSTPSRACQMTGLYSHQNGQMQLWEGIDSTKTFYPELLQKAGYQTAIVGKWHLPCDPKGFDYYHILNNQGEYYNPDFKGNNTNGKYIAEEGYVTHLTTKHAFEFLNKRDKNRPFCLLLNPKSPHRNWMPEEKYLGLYENIEFPIPETFYDDHSGRCPASSTQKMSIAKDMEMIQDLKVIELKDNPLFREQAPPLERELNRMTPEQRKKWDDFYGARNKKFLSMNLKGKELAKWKYQNYLRDYLRCVKSVDDEVGRVIDYLKKEGILDNTIIVFSSDQGFYMGEHGWFDKRFMYEESFHTPLIIRYPKAIKSGTESNALVQNIDFAPTFLSLAGVTKPAEMSGVSIEPLFTGKTPENWRKSIYYHYYDYPAFHMVRRHDGVRTDRYKLIHFYGKGGIRGANLPNQLKEGTKERSLLLNWGGESGRLKNEQDINCNELYDLQNDPKEMNNLYRKPGYEKVTAELQTLLDKYRKDLKVREY